MFEKFYYLRSNLEFMEEESVFDQYKYFKGERICPFGNGEYDKARFWEFEKRHFDDEYFSKMHFLEYFMLWITEKAAPNSGYDLSKGGNPWLDDYYENAP